MNRPSRLSLGCSVALSALAALALMLPVGEVSVARAAPNASASADAPASASASAAPVAVEPPKPPTDVEPPILAREWPEAESAEPTDEEWKAATDLRTVKKRPLRVRQSSDSAQTECTERAVREWIRIQCTPDHSNVYGDKFYGVIWGLAGDMTSVAGSMEPASSWARYAAAPQNKIDQMTRLFGGSATLVFRMKRGSARMFGFDEIGWVENYDGGPSMIARPGLIVDVSWALGEPGPTITYQ